MARGQFSGKSVALFVAALALIAAFFGWFFAHYSKQSQTVYRPLEGNRPYAAATLLLKNEGKTAAFVDNKKQQEALWNDPKNAKSKTIVLLDSQTGNERHFERALLWVKSGGHLVVFAGFSSFLGNKNTPDLLSYVGIQSRSVKWDANYKQFLAAPLALTEGGKSEAIVVRADAYLAFDGRNFFEKFDARPIDYRFLPALDGLNFSAEQKATFREIAKQSHDTYNADRVVLDAYMGEGRLTVLMQKNLWEDPQPTNDPAEDVDRALQKPAQGDRFFAMLDDGYKVLYGDPQGDAEAYYYGISAYDHAYFLRYLTKDSQEVWFLPTLQDRRFLPLLWENAPVFALAALGLVLAVLLALPRQFGSKKTLVDDSDSDMLLYFQGVGRYLWEGDRAFAQVDANRQWLLRRVRRRLPNLPSGDASRAIAESSGLPWEVVHLALYSDWRSPSEFVKMSKAFARVAQAFET